MVGRFMRAFDPTPRTMEAPIALVLVAFVALLIFQAWALWLEQPFDPYSFGIAAGAAMGGGGVASYGQGYMMRSRGMYSTNYSRPAATTKATGSAVVDDPDGGA